ncbi:response regulator [Larkinella rosea]|uniref:Response regulator n=1 Tax=Larkinella rosea TaxID=2025312 RepID=A0A3P1BA70_9BACT|nr:response regulator [Larkinella rosea]RRA97986.1 response regulator [Larkinella rosea]
MNPPIANQNRKADLSVRVLIVEDNFINQTFLSTLLRKYGVPSVVVSNGLEAINFLKSQRVDLILMDIQMPVMDGLTATQQIRQQLQLTVPVVAVTSNPEFDARPRCREAGMDDFLSKPIQKKQLEAILERFLPSKEEKPPVVNQDYLRDITGGDAGLLTELITLFKTDLSANRQALFAAIETNKRDEFDHLAHRFRSSLNSVAMLDTAVELKKLERNPTLTDAEIGQRLEAIFDEITIGIRTLDQLTEK